MKRKILACAALLLTGLSSLAAPMEAASREEIAAISVVQANDFKYWQENSPTKQKIIRFVEDVTNPASQNFIPEEDRIATFDMDGTFYCETAPYYFQEMMFLHRALEDETYEPSRKVRAFAERIQPKILSKTPLTAKEDKFLLQQLTECYKGMTPEEYRAYVRKFMDTEEIGLTGLKRGEAFYLPMVELISYLSNNGFAVYIDTACGIDTTREMVAGIPGIRYDRIMGTDFSYASTGLGKEKPDHHFFDRNKEKIIIEGPLADNAKTRKIFTILRQIGKKPVLAFGNSMGDSGMFEYTLQNDKYPSAAYCVLCDDTERELGNLQKAESMKKFAHERGWNTISMRDEFQTIYGDNVKAEHGNAAN